MTKVLIIESDSAFAQALSSGLAKYGCSVRVVEDGEEGIDAATRDKPALILLAIELSRMSGFSVCNKLKRHGELKSVPLALMSNEATEETFEQHKRLRTRADVYLHKPISVDKLVAELRPLVTLEKQVDDDEPLIDDEVVIDEAGEPELSASLDEEADQAFGNLVMPPVARAPSMVPPPPPSARPRPVPDDLDVEELEIEDDTHISSGLARPSQLDEELVASKVALAVASAQEELTRLNEALRAQSAQIADLEANVASAKAAAEAEADGKLQLTQKKDAEIELLQQELETLRRKLESNEAAGTAREFLDLREKLNKKDKEILDIRDELTSKEKALIKANDEAIFVGREKADLIDQVSALTTNKVELERQNVALSQDKEQAQKRGDDFKAKSERLQGELDGKIAELKQAIQNHENAIATKEAEMATLRVDHQDAMEAAAREAEAVKHGAVARAIAETEERAAGEKERALVEAAELAKREREQALLARGAELKAEHDAKMAALHRANEESLRKLRAEHAYDKEQEQQAALERLQTRERELVGDKEAALAELGAQKLAAEQERDQTIAELTAMLAERTAERDAARATILDREGTIAQLEAKVAALLAEISDLSERLQAESGLLASAREKWSSDTASMHAASEALRQALSQLDQAQARPMP